jgi:hypothetical protein
MGVEAEVVERESAAGPGGAVGCADSKHLTERFIPIAVEVKVVLKAGAGSAET